MIKQRTLKNVIRATGVGVHTGQKISLTLRPAPTNTGIIFRRTDQSPVVEIPALTQHVGDTSLSTCLMKDGVRVSTVEHLLSALYGVGVDNVYVDLTADEVPIMDGSAAPFVFLLQSAGIEEQSALKQFIKIKKPIEVRCEDKIAKISPYPGFKLSFDIEFSHPFFTSENQSVSFDFSTSSYSKEIARARTFGFLSDYEKIREMDLAAGASLDNAIVIDDYNIINKDGLRYPDECVRHKVLDAIGDMYLLGHPVQGAFTGRKSGHELNRQLTNKIMQQTDAWELVTYDAVKGAPVHLFPVEPTALAY